MNAETWQEKLAVFLDFFGTDCIDCAAAHMGNPPVQHDLFHLPLPDSPAGNPVLRVIGECNACRVCSHDVPPDRSSGMDCSWQQDSALPPPKSDQGLIFSDCSLAATHHHTPLLGRQHLNLGRDPFFKLRHMGDDADHPAGTVQLNQGVTTSLSSVLTGISAILSVFMPAPCDRQQVVRPPRARWQAAPRERHPAGRRLSWL